jgi:hypothetical protein
MKPIAGAVMLNVLRRLDYRALMLGLRAGHLGGAAKRRAVNPEPGPVVMCPGPGKTGKRAEWTPQSAPTAGMRHASR